MNKNVYLGNMGRIDTGKISDKLFPDDGIPMKKSYPYAHELKKDKKERVMKSIKDNFHFSHGENKNSHKNKKKKKKIKVI